MDSMRTSSRPRTPSVAVFRLVSCFKYVVTTYELDDATAAAD